MTKKFVAVIIFCCFIISFTSYALACNGSDCTYKGIKLYGKVKIVSSNADIKVQVVNNYPDFKVKTVNNYADSCGKWQFVENYPDFTIQFVDNYPGKV